MRARLLSRPKTTGPRPWRMLVVTMILSLLFGLVGMGEPLEDGLRVARNRAAPVAASGDIVVIKIDDKSQKEIGRWPWPRSVHAELVDRLSATGAKNILLDFTVQYSMNRRQDQLFADALARSRRVVLPVHLISGERSGKLASSHPLPQFAAHAKLGLISASYNYDTA